MSQFTQAGHLAALAATGLVTLGLCLAARSPRLRGPARRMASILGILLVANEVGYEVVRALEGTWSAADTLPLYLCDAAAFIAGAALICERPLLVEITYFWGIAGTLQGLITPDVYWSPNQYEYWQYYIDHGFVVVAAIYLVAGRRLQPRAGAWRRVFALTALFTIAAALADGITGGDYMYLRTVPDTGSLLDLMGPWPWYVVTGSGLAIVLLLLLDAPFRLRRRAALQSADPAPS